MLLPPLSKYIIVIRSFAPRLQSTYCVSCIMLGTRDTEIDKTDRTLALPEVTIWRESLTLTKRAGTQIHVYKSPGCQHSKALKRYFLWSPYCADMETETQMEQGLAQGHTARRWQGTARIQVSCLGSMRCPGEVH